jgi:phage regulator Rha-like protein
MTAVALTTTAGEPRVDSRLVADQLGLQHESVIKLIASYPKDFEEFGKVRFQIGASEAGQKTKSALLNEDQCYLLLAFSRNTAKVRELKVRLVRAFREARAGEQIHSAEYLPGYHALHDRAHELAGNSSNEKFVHMNLNKLVNKTVGIEAGARSKLPPAMKSRIVVAQELAAAAMESANDHHEAYAKAKDALGTLGRALRLK